MKTHRAAKWYHNQATTDYFTELVWAMLTLERRTYAADARVVPVAADELAGGADGAEPAV